MNSNELVEHYFAAWNETDPARRAELIALAWADDASYVDPLQTGHGHAGIDAMIRAVHERFPQFMFRRTAKVDGFADRLRFGWELSAPDGTPVARGSDFAVVDAGGRLAEVTGFLDSTPGSA